MADRAQHIVTGAVVGSLVYAGLSIYRQEPISPGGCLAALVLGGLAGSLPDLLEPASSPNHRAFFHSLVAGGFLVASNASVRKSQLPLEEKDLWSSLIFGYLSHLVLDGGTPKGLPLA